MEVFYLQLRDTRLERYHYGVLFRHQQQQQLTLNADQLSRACKNKM